VSLFLNPVGDPTDQQVAAQPSRRHRSVEPAPFDLKIGCRQRFERDDPGFNVSLGPTACCEIFASRNRHHAPASAMR
jgi:hypothetical protein